MELRHLRYFVAVAEQQHFRRAARLLHVSQSPLSRQIRQLEAEMGVALFEPSGRGVKLTNAGQVFLERVRVTLAQVQAAVADAQDAGRGQLGVLRVGFEAGSAYTGLLPDIVSAFRVHHPRVQLQLVPMLGAAQWPALNAGEISLGYCSQAPQDASFQVLELFEDRVAVVLPRRHPLAKKKSLRMQDLANQRFIWNTRAVSPELYLGVVSAFRARGMTLDIREEADGEALLTLVASGEGLTFELESTRPLFRGRTLLRPVRDLAVTVKGLAIWRKEGAGSAPLRTMIEISRKLRARG